MTTTFRRWCLVGAIFASTWWGFSDAALGDETDSLSAPPAYATVFSTWLPTSVQGGIIRDAMVKRMVNSLVQAAAEKPDIAAAWKTFIRIQDRIGIKVSTTGAPVSSTHIAIVKAITEGLLAAGVPAHNIIIWDRMQEDLDRAKLSRLEPPFRVMGTDRAGGYSEKAILTVPIMGKLIAGDHEFSPTRTEQVSSRSHLSSILADKVDKVIHVPALADSVFAGVSGAVSGMVLDNLDNWRRLARAPQYGDPYLPEAYADPRIAGKVVLTILDALRPQYAGGPFPGAGYNVNYGGIFVSRDPVALDAIGMRLLDGFRRDAGFPPLAKYTSWLQSAEHMGLGFASEDKIKIIRIIPEGEVRKVQP